MLAKSVTFLVLPLLAGVALVGCGDDGSSPAPAAAAAAAPPSAAAPPIGSTPPSTSPPSIPPPSIPPPPGTPPPNSAPTIQGTPQVHVVAGQPYHFSPSADDADGDALGFFIVNRPPWAAFDAATGRLHGTPSAGDLGNWSGIEIGATDGAARASLPLFAITVASAPGGAVLVGWTRPTENTDDSPLTDLAGYKIYWGSDPNRLEQSATIRTLGQTNHVVEPLPAGTWYFAVTAFNDQNVESDLSQPVAAVVR